MGKKLKGKELGSGIDHRNIQPVPGKMRLADVKPPHCKMVLNLMDDRYAGSTIRQAYQAV